MNLVFDRDRWLALLARLDLPADVRTFEELSRAYDEPQRHYHNAQHIADCLAIFDRAPATEQPGEVELALWFHDAIYDPQAADNELRSADWCTQFLTGNRVPRDRIERIRDNILATRHVAQPERSDAQLVIDIDLSILGREADIYDRYAAAIRREYQHVPENIFRTKRAEVLQGFLARPSIYFLPWFIERFENRARDNLAREIAAMRNGN